MSTPSKETDRPVEYPKRGMRFEVTGTWSGPRSPAGDYNAAQHREVVTDRKLILFIKGTRSITFTDGTALHLDARPLAKGERAGKPVDGYRKLIRDCARYGVSSVAALIGAQVAEKALSGGAL